MSPSELWDAFEAAYLQCPQSREMDSDAEEDGQPGAYAKLKKTYGGTIGYWLDDSTIGGSVLLRSGYIECLDPAIVEMCDQYEAALRKASKKIAKEIFGA